MARHDCNVVKNLLDSPRVRQAARELLAAVAEETSQATLSPNAYE
jgi:hypothetical protein